MSQLAIKRHLDTVVITRNQVTEIIRHFVETSTGRKVHVNGYGNPDITMEDVGTQDDQTMVTVTLSNDKLEN